MLGELKGVAFREFSLTLSELVCFANRELHHEIHSTTPNGSARYDSVVGELHGVSVRCGGGIIMRFFIQTECIPVLSYRLRLRSNLPTPCHSGGSVSDR